MHRHETRERQESVYGLVDRRGFLRTVGGAAAAGLLRRPARAARRGSQVVPEDDARLDTSLVEYPGATGPIKAYFAKAKKNGKSPAVLVISENRGLNANIRDVARRVALEGYLALAPDPLTPLGGTPANAEEAPGMIQKLDRPSTVKNLVAAAEYLRTRPESTGKVGVMGFCWGGGMTNQVAVNDPKIDAAAPFYGPQPAAEDVPKIRAPLLLHYAGEDQRIDAGIPAYEEELKKAGVEYHVYIYPGAQHGFFNDTSPRYDAEAAKLAWKRTLDFFDKKLRR